MPGCTRTGVVSSFPSRHGAFDIAVRHIKLAKAALYLPGGAETLEFAAFRGTFLRWRRTHKRHPCGAEAQQYCKIELHLNLVPERMPSVHTRGAGAQTRAPGSTGQNEISFGEDVWAAREKTDPEQ